MSCRQENMIERKRWRGLQSKPFLARIAGRKPCTDHSALFLLPTIAKNTPISTSQGISSRRRPW